MTILQDVRTATVVFREVRRARKAGEDAVEIKPVRTLPCYTIGYTFLDTIEGPLCWNHSQDAYKAVKEVFIALPDGTKRQLASVPEKPGEWAERARFWQQKLRPVLTPEMYHAVIIKFIRWYIHCLRMDKKKLREVAE